MTVNVSAIAPLLACSIFLLASGCTSTGNNAANQAPKLERISAEELDKLMTPPAAKLTLDELVSLSKQGNSPDQIIAKIKATDSMYDLTPSQALELSQKGVDARVLDYIHESREAAVRNNLADEINRRERQKQEEVAKLKNRLSQQQRRYYDPFCRGYYGLMPYGYGGYGRHFGSRFGFGAGLGMPLGCW